MKKQADHITMTDIEAMSVGLFLRQFLTRPESDEFYIDKVVVSTVAEALAAGKGIHIEKVSGGG